MTLSTDVGSSAESPAEIARRIAGGDRQAEQLLVERYQRPLLEMLRYRGRDPDLAYDLLQEAFTITILRLRSGGIDDPNRLVAFMHGTAQNLVTAHYRKEVRRNTYADSEAIEVTPDSGDGQLETLLAKEKTALVRRLIDELKTPRDRELLRRYYVLEQAKEIVCDALDVSPAHFNRVIFRARQRFRTIVEQRLSDYENE